MFACLSFSCCSFFRFSLVLKEKSKNFSWARKLKMPEMWEVRAGWGATVNSGTWHKKSILGPATKSKISFIQQGPALGSLNYVEFLYVCCVFVLEAFIYFWRAFLASFFWIVCFFVWLFVSLFVDLFVCLFVTIRWWESEYLQTEPWLCERRSAFGPTAIRTTPWTVFFFKHLLHVIYHGILQCTEQDLPKSKTDNK